MQLATPYWCAEAVLSADACDRIVQLGDELRQRQSKTPVEDPHRQIRRSTNAWLKGYGDDRRYQWIYDQLTQYVLQINKRLWCWNLYRFEPLQYTKYTSSDHYTWHADQKREPYGEDSEWAGLIRKLTISVQLSDPDDYEGGEFEIEVMSNGPQARGKRIRRPEALQKKGSAIVFPSFLYHRVSKVQRGTRKSLVGWYLGPSFF